MDRSELGCLKNIGFKQLWGLASDEVVAATRELWTLLGWNEDHESEDVVKDRREFCAPFLYN